MEKIKLVESFIVTDKEYSKVEDNTLTESEKLLSIEEAGNKKSYKAEAIYTFPISKPGQKNLNERIYPVKLWEKVIKEQQGFGNYGLMDHPEKEGSTKDAFCVWRNVRFSENKKLVLADAYLFGPWGRQVKEALEAGGKVGLSTSGFGEFEKDEMTVRADTYELERVADHVLNPSYAVFGEQDHVIPTEKEIKKESFEKEETINIIKEDTGDKKMADKKMTTFEEKSFRLNIESRIKELAKIENLTERITQYEELLQYFEDDIASDLKTLVEERLKESKVALSELAEKGSQIDSIVESSKKELIEKIDSLEKEKTDLNEIIESLASKYDKATELLDSIKVYSNKMKEMYEVAVAEKNGMISATEYKEALIYIEDLEAEKDELKEAVKYLKSQKLKEKHSFRKRALELEEKAKCKSEEEDDEEDEDDEEEEMKEDYSAYNAPSEVISYYEDLEYANPAVSKIKGEILGCRTLIEAQRTYLRLKGLVYMEEDHERRPGVSKSTYFEGREKEVRKPLINSAKLVREGWM